MEKLLALRQKIDLTHVDICTLTMQAAVLNANSRKQCNLISRTIDQYTTLACCRHLNTTPFDVRLHSLHVMIHGS